MLRRTVPRVFDKGVPGLTSIDRSYKSAPLTFFLPGNLSNARVSFFIILAIKITALVILWSPPQFARDGAQETKKS